MICLSKNTERRGLSCFSDHSQTRLFPHAVAVWLACSLLRLCLCSNAVRFGLRLGFSLQRLPAAVLPHMHRKLSRRLLPAPMTSAGHKRCKCSSRGLPPTPLLVSTTDRKICDRVAAHTAAVVAAAYTERQLSQTGSGAGAVCRYPITHSTGFFNIRTRLIYSRLDVLCYER